MSYKGEKLGAFIVPTGVGASIGGYAGDASVWARMVSEKCRLIVNPNVVNAACFSGINEKMLYVEGYTLDKFFKGECRLNPVKKNKIGIVYDKAISKSVLNVHINTTNAVKTVYGIDIIGYEVTEKAAGVEFFIDSSGASVGNVANLSDIKKASEKLIEKGANAIAIVCAFPEDESEDYASGSGVDPVGGVEAIISHYISKELNIPCAHSPAFENISITTNIVDAKCSAEYITPTFLPCILLGLNQAPQIREVGISVSDLDFLIMPYNSLGSIPPMCMNKLSKKIYAVKENKTVLDVTPQKLGLNCEIVNSYQELIQIL